MILRFKDKKVIQIFVNIKEHQNYKGLCKLYNLYIPILMAYIRKFHFEYILSFSNYVSETFVHIEFSNPFVLFQLLMTHDMLGDQS